MFRQSPFFFSTLLLNVSTENPRTNRALTTLGVRKIKRVEVDTQTTGGLKRRVKTTQTCSRQGHCLRESVSVQDFEGYFSVSDSEVW